jgi:hypothetical protein
MYGRERPGVIRVDLDERREPGPELVISDRVRSDVFVEFGSQRIYIDKLIGAQRHGADYRRGAATFRGCIGLVVTHDVLLQLRPADREPA